MKKARRNGLSGGIQAGGSSIIGVDRRAQRRFGVVRVIKVEVGLSQQGMVVVAVLTE